VFPYGQIELAISQASYLGSKAVNLSLNGGVRGLGQGLSPNQLVRLDNIGAR